MNTILNRRELLSGASAAAIALGLPEQSDAWTHGSAVGGVNNNRVTINAPSSFLNIAKGFAFNIDPNNSSSDGYPITTPAGTLGGSGAMPAGYYGQTVWKFSGQGSMQTSGAMVVTSANANGTTSCIVELFGGTPTTLAPLQVFGNITILSQTNPRVAFTWGWLIQSISNNGSGLVRVTVQTNGFDNSGVANGSTVFITGTGITGLDNNSFVLSRASASAFDLTGSTFTSSSGVGGMAAYTPIPLNLNMYPSGTYGSGATQMSGLVLCKIADETDINNGLIVDSVLISKLQDLYNTGSRGNPGWLRFMDMVGVQTNFEADFSQRMPATYIGYAALRYPLGYWSGNVSWSSGDNYGCSDPSVTTWDSPNSVYFDNAVVQGLVNLNNIGTNPTLAIGAHPAKPIYNFGISIKTIKLWGPLPSAANQTITFTFTASWLSGLPGVVGTTRTLSYVTNTGASFTATVASGSSATFVVSGLSGGATLFPGNVFYGNSLPQGIQILSQSSGTTGSNGTYIATQPFNTGGVGLSCTIRDDTQSYDGATGLRDSLNQLWNGDPALSTAGMSFGNNGSDGLNTAAFRTPHAGALTISNTAGPTGFGASVGVLQPCTFSDNANFANTFRSTMAGSIVTGDVLHFTFTRADIPGGAETVSYTTNTSSNGPGGVPDSSLQNLVTNLVAQINGDGALQAVGIQSTTTGVPTANSFDLVFGQSPTISSFLGSITGSTLTVTLVNFGTIAAGAYLNNTGKLYVKILPFGTGGATGTGGVGTYALSVAPGNSSTGYWTGIPTGDGSVCNSWIGGGVVLTFSKISGSGTETATIGSAGTVKASFIYNYLLDGWLYRGPSGIIQSQPFEVIAEMCNRVGTHCWFCWGTHKGPLVTAVANFFATNLNPGLRFGTEIGNEVWNFSASGPYGQWLAFGSSLGFSSGGPGPIIYSYAALRLIQYTALGKAAWIAAGRSASDYWVHQPAAGFDLGTTNNFAVNQLNGTQLNASTNTTYATYGGLNGSGSSPSYNASPNRPVDITKTIGWAPYWNDLWFSSIGLAGMNGTVAQNAPWLQASLDFTNGLFSTAYTSLVNQFNQTTARSGGTADGNALGNGSYTNVNFCDVVFAANETLAAAYDADPVRSTLGPLNIFHYESGNQWAPTSPIGTPLNSVNATAISNLANTMTNLGWNVSPYTVSGTNNATEAATQVINMIQAWKFDATYKNLIKTYYYQHLVNASAGKGRETHPAQYGWAGDVWGIFPSDFHSATPYASYAAIKEWNA
jgi:hypothetical protein